MSTAFRQIVKLVAEITKNKDPFCEVMESAMNALNTELNPICKLLALLGDQNILQVRRIRVNKIHGRKNVK